MKICRNTPISDRASRNIYSANDAIQLVFCLFVFPTFLIGKIMKKFHQNRLGENIHQKFIAIIKVVSFNFQTSAHSNTIYCIGIIIIFIELMLQNCTAACIRSFNYSPYIFDLRNKQKDQQPLFSSIGVFISFTLKNVSKRDS